MMDVFQFTSLLGLGFLLGLKHALDADHVVAVSTIVSETKSITKSALAGLFWGLGHSAMLIAVGLIILIFHISIPKSVTLFFEFLVALMLLWLGFDVLKKVSREKYHLHKHTHGGIEHAHLHSHKTSVSHKHAHKSFGVGMVHGLAGSATIMLLILTTVESTMQGLLYILLFGIGSSIGMLLVSGIISLPFIMSHKFMQTQAILKQAAGLISIILGFTLVYNIVFQDFL